MMYPTTLSVTAKVDMQDPLTGFVSHKLMPGARLHLGDQSYEHRFTYSGEKHRFTVTANLDTGQHRARLEFIEDHTVLQGAIEVLDVHVQGTPLGLEMYQCEYLQWETGETIKSNMYLGRPGAWSILLRVPVGDVGFV